MTGIANWYLKDILKNNPVWSLEKRKSHLHKLFHIRFFLDGFLSQSALDILEILQNILNKIFVLILTTP